MKKSSLAKETKTSAVPLFFRPKAALFFCASLRWVPLGIPAGFSAWSRLSWRDDPKYCSAAPIRYILSS